MGEPSGITIDDNGVTYIADARAYRVLRITPGGALDFYIGDPTGQAVACANSLNVGFLNRSSYYLCSPSDMARAPSGRPAVLDTGHGKVLLDQVALGSTLTLLAGGDSSNQTAEGLPATSASLQGSSGVLWDPAGQLVVVDTGRNRIRHVVEGSIATFVGTGVAGFAGDGSAATAAQLNTPSDATYDSAGNLFIADTGNNRIRRVDAITGVITTVAGNGAAGFSGDGGAALAAQLNAPTDVLVVGSSLLIADRLNHRVRIVDLATGLITTAAGTGGTEVAGLGTVAHIDRRALAHPTRHRRRRDGAGQQPARRLQPVRNPGRQALGPAPSSGSDCQPDASRAARAMAWRAVVLQARRRKYTPEGRWGDRHTRTLFPREAAAAAS